MTIRNPDMQGDSLTYRVDVLDGALPTSAGPCALLIAPADSARIVPELTLYWR